MTINRTDTTIYLIAIINSILLIIVFGVYSQDWDTYSYIDAWDNSLAHATIDKLRTPIYPLFIGICKFIFGTNYMLACIIFQHIVFIISIHYFKQMLAWKVNSSKIVTILSLIYILLPSISSWANCLLTELFALVGIIFLFYNIFAFQHKAKLQNILCSIFWLAFLIFLRPAFIFLFPAITIALLLMYNVKKRTVIIGVVGIALVGFAEVLYCIKYNDLYGIFAPSSVSTINQSYIAFEKRLIDTTDTDDTEFQECILENKGKKIFPITIIESYGLATVQQAVSSSQNRLPVLWGKNILLRIRKAASYSYMSTHSGSRIINEMLTININILYIFLFVCFIFIIYRYISIRKLYITFTILWITIFGNLSTVIIGAQDEYGRLLVPTIPLILIMIGQAFNYIKININGNTKET